MLMRDTMSEQPRPKNVLIQEVRLPCGGRSIMEGEDVSATNRLLAQVRAARPSAKNGGAGGATSNSGGPVKK